MSECSACTPTRVISSQTGVATLLTRTSLVERLLIPPRLRIVLLRHWPHTSSSFFLASYFHTKVRTGRGHTRMRETQQSETVRRAAAPPFCSTFVLSPLQSVVSEKVHTFINIYFSNSKLLYDWIFIRNYVFFHALLFFFRAASARGRERARGWRRAAWASARG